VTTEASPDRYDALVWAIVGMMKEPTPRIRTM
jgi:phage terminase large subunit-like protein